MKRTILLLIIGNFFFISYSQVEEDWLISELQVKEEIVFEIPKSEIVVKLSENEYYQNNSPPNTFFTLYVNCPVHCSQWKRSSIRDEWKRSAIRELFEESTYGYKKDFDWRINLKTMDSLFQNLYNWIKEIENFINNHKKVGDTITMKYHNNSNSTLGGENYFLKANSSYITIYTNIFLRDQRGYLCNRWTKMKLKIITEFKNYLLEYTTTHKINIRI